MATTPLCPEDSAQGTRARPNPLVIPSIARARAILGREPGVVVDQGAGRLRHLDLLLNEFDHLLLVDTKRQLERKQSLYGIRQNVYAVVEDKRAGGADLDAMTASEFGNSSLGADLILSTAVYDVVPPDRRSGLAESAARNMAAGGLYLVIVPRNDQSIIVRCGAENAWADGHVFVRSGSSTFYANFRDHTPLIELFMDVGLQLLEDRSTYRYVRLMLQLPR
jgi:hypothetical protein